jgi:Bacterial pre-peptidase C-terminal domain
VRQPVIYRSTIPLVQNPGPLSHLATLWTQLTEGCVSNLSGVDGSKQYFRVTVPTSRSSLTITISGGSGDADLYVKRGSLPTLTSWDIRPYLYGNGEFVRVSNPAADHWYIMIHGYAAYAGLMLRVQL